MASFSDRFAPKRKIFNDDYEIMDSSDSSKRLRSQSDAGMDEVFSSVSTNMDLATESHNSTMPSPCAPGRAHTRQSSSELQRNGHYHPIYSPFTVPQNKWPPPQQIAGLQQVAPAHVRSESANSTQLQSRFHGQVSPQKLQQQSSVSQATTWNAQAFLSAAAAVPAGSIAAAADSGVTSMEEDSSAGMRHSNSAPDLHLVLQESLQSLPRTLLDGNQQPLSSSVMGALVPYTHPTSTKGGMLF